jgi:hypothetical protein
MKSDAKEKLMTEMWGRGGCCAEDRERKSGVRKKTKS